MDSDKIVRQHLSTLLQGKGAHLTFQEAVANFPAEHINTTPPKVPYTPWHLIEHLRLAQWDILEYIRDPDHISPDWPAGYWPDRDTTTDLAGWQTSIDRFQSDLQALQTIVADPATDLYEPIPHGYDGHTILREILIVADHNAYHVGELAILRQVMGTWPKGR